MTMDQEIQRSPDGKMTLRSKALMWTLVIAYLLLTLYVSIMGLSIIQSYFQLSIMYVVSLYSVFYAFRHKGKYSKRGLILYFCGVLIVDALFTGKAFMHDYAISYTDEMIALMGMGLILSLLREQNPVEYRKVQKDIINLMRLRIILAIIAFIALIWFLMAISR